MTQRCLMLFLLLGLVITASALSESFTSTQFPPPGWVRYNFGAAPDDSWERFTGYYRDPPACARIWYDTPNNDWLITPRCSVATGDSLTFYHRNNQTSVTFGYETLYVRISTTNRDTGSFTDIGYVTRYNDINWYDTSFSLNAYAGQKIYIAFHYRMQDWNYGISIDSIIGPAEVLVYDAATIQATMRGPYIVGSPKNAFAIAKNVGYLTPPISFSEIMTIMGPSLSWMDVQTINNLPVDSSARVNFNTWTPDTEGIHTFRVHCSLANDSNPNNDTISRQIEVAPIYYTPPYTQNFNSPLWDIYGETPCGWTILANGTSDTNELHWNTNDWHRYVFTGGDTVASAIATTEDTTHEIMISPRINCTVTGNYILRFWMYYYQSFLLRPDSGMVLISSDGGSTWNQIAKYKNSIQSAGYRTFDVTSYASGQADVRVMFRYLSANDGYWQIDNFFLGTLGVPSLISPANDSLINDPTPTFQWSIVPGAENYQIQVTDDSLFLTTIINMVVNTDTFTPTTPITPDGTFYWRARAGVGSVWTSWTNSYRFFLDATPPMPCTLNSPVNGETLWTTTPTFLWSEISDAASYQIQIATDPFFTGMEIDTMLIERGFPSPPLAFGSHYWRVRAFDAAQNSSAWTIPWVFYIGVGASSQWQAMADIPTASASGKVPKYGSASAALNGKIYFLNGTNTQDFYCFIPDSGVGSWTVLETMPIGTKDAGDGKRPKKGTAMAPFGNAIYVLRGNNTFGFWKYVADTTPGVGETLGWNKLPNIPEGARGKKVKDGSGLVHFTALGSREYMFAMKGRKTEEFYIYDIAANIWTPIVKTDPGTSGKIGYKKGSCLAYDGYDLIYVLKGYYGDFFSYSISGDSWHRLRQYDRKIFINRDGKKKKIKDGAGLVYYNDNLYLLKGGKTNEFWKYEIASDSWIQMPENWDIPLGASGKKVKGGGTLCILDGYFYVSKGNKTNEFYRHVPPTMTTAQTSNLELNQGAMDIKKSSTSNFTLSIVPNPAVNMISVRYSLPVASSISLKLYNICGELVKSYVHSTPTMNGLLLLDTKRLPAGVYLLRFSSDKIRTTHKLVLKK
ncbi:MAG: T9SS type A sorting domain-containing protein [candidate division WOR-3 bacterium]|nr:T9SS type A sorting domain-containing protein [candidate division WOR-3 bacterium]